ncbi:MAG TPA: PD-(D/E)XK nuclease family protein [Campylobacterales bacterium]|nr:PD-(D/E)XK nuclease family protein [Campylobacterales bacterium]
MKELHIYPTSRAIRKRQEELREQSGLLPTLMRVDEFEKRTLLLPEVTMVDPLQRRLILQEASHFEAFQQLKINRDLVRFFTKSDAIFKFFEELSHEEVSFHDLVAGDAYAEFEAHIDILEELLINYRQRLDAKGLTDRVFLPEIYELNQGFIEGYDRFEFHLEGYLSRFELRLIEQIAEQKPFVIRMQTSRFNTKVQERFEALGITLPEESMVTFDLHTRSILHHEPTLFQLEAQVVSVEERLAQIPILLASVQKMVDQGIAPEEIVVILPDESFKERLKLYDRHNNFNFAMGFAYAQTRSYKRLEAIYHSWQRHDEASVALLRAYGIDRDRLQRINPNERVSIEEFFQRIEPLGLDSEREIVMEKMLYFQHLFAASEMKIEQWLFVWLKQLSELSLDDVRGGKATVMGALETRGVHFEGVVIVDFNDGIVPAIPAKDSFLNSSLRKFANLPTKNDREALQKQIYKRLLEEAKEATIIYSLSDNKAPAGYLYELGLGLGESVSVETSLLYRTHSLRWKQDDPIIPNFDARTIAWSATRLKTFLGCKRKYYYHYIKQLKPSPKDELNEGAILHTVLEETFKERTHFDNASMMQEALGRAIDKVLETDSPKIAYYKLLWKAKLQGFVDQQLQHFKAGWQVVERERSIAGDIGGIRFKGVVDRIDQDSTHTLILDYKSGAITEANRTKNLEKLTDFQMSIYHELLKERYPTLDLAFVELFNQGKVTPITELEAKTEQLYAVIEALRSMDEVVCTRCENVSLCQYCDYTLLCERGDYL